MNTDQYIYQLYQDILKQFPDKKSLNKKDFKEFVLKHLDNFNMEIINDTNLTKIN
jgi:hypothetical protein